MKKLTKLKLAKNVEVLEDNEMKYILGGNYSSSNGCDTHGGTCNGGDCYIDGTMISGKCEWYTIGESKLCACVK